MKVKRLNQRLFEDECGRLADLISEWEPIVLVGIETGGAVVGKSILSNLDDSTHYFSIKIQRASSNTVKKSGLVKQIISSLPEFAVRFLRKAEMHVSELKSKFVEPHREVTIDLDLEALEIIKKSRKVVIVDDAVDTGKTLMLAVSYFQSINDENEIRTAVLTTTHKNPMIKPDYSLYERTVLQFPWSLDSK